MAQSGLFHGPTRELVPLDGVHVAVQIVNLVAEVQIVQFFVNASSSTIDCVYEFPMDESGAVCGFEVELPDRLLIGEVKEKQEARAEYNAAVARGQTAALLEQNKPDIFSQRIGNIPPLSRVNIRIIYVTELKVDRETGGAIFVLPTSVAPRYSPYSGSIAFTRPWHQICCGRRIIRDSFDSRWDGRVENLPWQPWTHGVPQFVVNEQRPGAFSITIEAEMASRVLSMESKTYPVNVEHAPAANANKVSASLWNQTEPMGKDLEIIVYQEKPHEPSVQLEMAADGTGCAMLTMVPEFDLEPVKTEIVFLVDCSGSMQGTRIEAAKRALLVFLQSLPVSCEFNIVRFGDSFNWLNPGRAIPYNSSTLASARTFVQGTSANLGGTEIARPLEGILSPRPPLGIIRQVFVLTDGQVSNTEQVLRLCRNYAEYNRVFSVGIGDEVSRHLVQGMARAANGTCEFILGKELTEGSHALEIRLLNQLKVATYPGIDKVLVDWFAGDSVPMATTVPAPTPSRFFPTGPAASPGAMSFNGQHPTAATAGPSPHAAGSGTWYMPPGNVDASGAQPLGRNDLAYQAPFLPRPLFSGSKFVMFCFLKSPENTTHVNVVANAPGGELSLSVPVTKVASVGKTIHILAARALIRDLDEETSHLHYRKVIPHGRDVFGTCRPFSSWIGQADGSRAGRAGAWNLEPLVANAIAVKAEMVDIGTKYGIVSKETSFVAVERFRDGRLGSAETPPPLPSSSLSPLNNIQQSSQILASMQSKMMMAQPALLQSADLCMQQSAYLYSAAPRQESVLQSTASSLADFASSISSRLSSVRASLRSSPVPSSSAPSSAPDPLPIAAMLRFKVSQPHTMECESDDCDEWDDDEPASQPAPQESGHRVAVVAKTYQDILRLQIFDGSIQVSEASANVLGFPSMAELTKAFSASFGRTPVSANVLEGLCFALAFLSALATQHGATRSVWEMAAEKTKQWLLSQLSAADPATSRKEYGVRIATASGF